MHKIFTESELKVKKNLRQHRYWLKKRQEPYYTRKTLRRGLKRVDKIFTKFEAKLRSQVLQKKWRLANADKVKAYKIMASKLRLLKESQRKS